jgi:hypothetical protein
VPLFLFTVYTASSQPHLTVEIDEVDAVEFDIFDIMDAILYPIYIRVSGLLSYVLLGSGSLSSDVQP